MTGETLVLFNREAYNGRFYPNDGMIRGDMVDLVKRLVQLYK